MPRWMFPIAIAALAAGLPAAVGRHAGAAPAAMKPPPSPSATADRQAASKLRRAIVDLIETFGTQYPDGPAYLARLDALEKDANRPSADRARELQTLRQEALLANPLLASTRVLLVKRAAPKGGDPAAIGYPSNHECNSSLARGGYKNEIAVLFPARPDGKIETLCQPPDGGYAGEIDLHWDGDRVLFTRSDRAHWSIWEIRADGKGLRQVSKLPDDVDAFDACNLPNGRIVFGCTASYQSVPCWHGQRRVSNLYIMEADGSGVRQVCFDQDHDFHPVVLGNGQILFHRWDYTGINHIFLRQLMVMNPDGTGQRAVYKSNSWFPNGLYFPRELPGTSGRLVCILSGYHGVHRAGQLVVVDTRRGWHEADGLVLRISGRGDPITPMIRDRLVDGDWPKFLTPWPISEKYFLVSCQMDARSPWAICLADVFDNLVPVREEPGFALLEPVPLRPSPRPPVIPDRVVPGQRDATVYIHEVHSGDGLRGVPRGTVKRLRVFAYHFGYPGLAGPDKVGYGGPWEVMRVLGTAPVEEDGSAFFRVPANTPIAFQAIDAQGAAVQLMRSWVSAMPGEVVSCVGWHEPPGEAAAGRLVRAAVRPPRDLEPWRGPARGFDFAREVQPVLDRHCVACHQGGAGGARPDLRPREQVKDYKGLRPSALEISRLHPQMKKDTNGVFRFAPAYDALIQYIRRVGIEDDVSLLVPGEYHAGTSELVQMLRKGHQGVTLDEEAWDRLITWIDLNAPCHGTWGEVYPIPDNVHARRMELRRKFGGPDEDPESIPNLPRLPSAPVKPAPMPKIEPVVLAGWPFGAEAARARQAAGGPVEKTVDLGGGVTMKLVRIPAGEFVMGDAAGEPDERPLARVPIREPFWLGATEVTVEQFRRFDPAYDPRYYQRRHARSDDQGIPLNEPRQPAVRVSWEQAMAFCRWLSERAGHVVTLPTEAQWEYACRDGSDTPLSYGGLDADFSPWANMADRSFSPSGIRKIHETGAVEHLVLEGAALSDARFDDKAVVTAPGALYKPNAWGLHDMHGNAAEWTLSAYRPYPYREDDGRNDAKPEGLKAVRGGSFFDRPARCRSAFRLAYPAWQRVFNVGFRVAAPAEGGMSR
jgi:formylglycine-generating enzyme required for sulfatase activity